MSKDKKDKKNKKTLLQKLRLMSTHFDTQNGVGDDVLIDIRNLTKSYKSKKVLKGINLTIKEGEHLAILGPNGAGKTTLTEIIATIKEPTEGKIYYSFGDKKKKITSNIGMQFQDSSYPPTYKVIDLVNFFAKSGRNSLKKEQINEFLEIFNLTKFKSYHADSLSGGQRQRLNILLSLLNSPKLLILDELSTGLDIDSVERVQKYIIDYIAKNKITLILISHDPEEIKTLTNRIVMLDRGIIAEDRTIEDINQEFGDVETYLFDFFEKKAANRHHYDISEDFDFKEYKPKKQPTTNYEYLTYMENKRIFDAKEQIKFLKWKKSLELESLYQEELDNKAKETNRYLAKQVVIEDEDFEEGKNYIPNAEKDDFLIVDNITKKYGKKEILKGVNFKIKKNERVAIIGANGAGKTTLTEIIATIKDATKGKVYYSFGRTKNQITSKIGMQFQDSSYPVMYTVKNLIYFFARANHTSMSTYEIHKALKIFNLYKYRNHIADSLSGGQKQRLNVLITLIKNPKLLILDEVSTGLDIEAVEEIKSYILNYLTKYDATLILVSHNIKEIADMTDRVIALKDGVVYRDVLIKDLRKEYNLDRSYNAIKRLTEELFSDEVTPLLNEEGKIEKTSDLIIDNFEFKDSTTSEDTIVENDKLTENIIQEIKEEDTQEEHTLELKDILDEEAFKDFQEEAADNIDNEFVTNEIDSETETIEMLEAEVEEGEELEINEVIFDKNNDVEQTKEIVLNENENTKAQLDEILAEIDETDKTLKELAVEEDEDTEFYTIETIIGNNDSEEDEEFLTLETTYETIKVEEELSEETQEETIKVEEELSEETQEETIKVEEELPEETQEETIKVEEELPEETQEETIKVEEDNEEVETIEEEFVTKEFQTEVILTEPLREEENSDEIIINEVVMTSEDLTPKKLESIEEEIIVDENLDNLFDEVIIEEEPLLKSKNISKQETPTKLLEEDILIEEEIFIDDPKTNNFYNEEDSTQTMEIIEFEPLKRPKKTSFVYQKRDLVREVREEKFANRPDKAKLKKSIERIKNKRLRKPLNEEEYRLKQEAQKAEMALKIEEAKKLAKARAKAEAIKKAEEEKNSSLIKEEKDKVNEAKEKEKLIKAQEDAAKVAADKKLAEEKARIEAKALVEKQRLEEERLKKLAKAEEDKKTLEEEKAKEEAKELIEKQRLEEERLKKLAKAEADKKAAEAAKAEAEEAKRLRIQKIREEKFLRKQQQREAAKLNPENNKSKGKKAAKDAKRAKLEAKKANKEEIGFKEYHKPVDKNWKRKK